MSVIGFVDKLNTKSGTSSKGPWTLYSLRLQGKDGDILPGWYSCGFTAPACKEGDYVKLDATAKGDNWEVVDGSIKVSKNPPAKPAAPENKGGGGKKGGYSGPKTKTSELFGEIGGYNTEDDIRRMSYSAARSDAVTVAELLVTAGALPLVSPKSKAGKAKNFDIITAAVDKLTVEFFFDAATGRKLETVADTEVDTSGDGELPDAEDESFDEPKDDFEDEDFEDGADDDDFE
jgi:hypothetical protein